MLFSAINHPHGKQKGLTLVELLVAMLISLVLAASISSIIISGERNKRQLTSTNDMEIGVSYAMVQLDSLLRSAGSGFSQGSKDAELLGCYLAAGSGASAALPRTTAWPAPFENVMAGATGNLIMAPLLIAEGAGAHDSDVLITMRGNAAAGDVLRNLESENETEKKWLLASNLGFRINDLVIVGNKNYHDCLFGQVAALDPMGKFVELETTAASRFYTPLGPESRGGNSVTPRASLLGIGSDVKAYMVALGTLGPAGDGVDSNVQFYLLGVDADANLHRFDILKMNGAADADNNLILSDNVVTLRAIYGLDTNQDGKLDTWASPKKDTAFHKEYQLGRLTTDKKAKLSEIIALRVALVVRSQLMEKEAVAPEKLILFEGLTDSSDLSLEEEFEITQDNTGLANAQNYRHRVVEATIPIRNALLATDPRF